MAKTARSRLKKAKRVYTLNRFRKASDLLEAALQDLRKTEKLRKRFKIAMGAWHDPGDEKCAVCLAGCVMAHRLHVPDNKDYQPISFKPADCHKLYALNEFRSGLVRGGGL